VCDTVFVYKVCVRINVYMCACYVYCVGVLHVCMWVCYMCACVHVCVCNVHR